MTDSEHRMTATEHKLAVLTILKLFGGLTDLRLLTFLTEEKLMNYFDMMIALNDLCEHGQCSRREVPGGYRYTITPAGEEALSLFSKDVPFSLRDRIQSAYDRCRDDYRRAQEYPTDIRQTGRGEYRLNMRMVEKDMETLSVTLSLPDEGIARRIAEKWPKLAEKIYRGFFETDGEAYR